VKELVPLPTGTVTTIPVSDHPEAFGTTVALTPVDDWVNTTWPGEPRKPLPFISIGSPTGLEGLIELLTFKTEGTGSLVEEPQPTRNARAATTPSTLAARCHFLRDPCNQLSVDSLKAAGTDHLLTECFSFDSINRFDMQEIESSVGRDALRLKYRKDALSLS
jgi:hypothetical protein